METMFTKRLATLMIVITVITVVITVITNHSNDKWYQYLVVVGGVQDGFSV